MTASDAVNMLETEWENIERELGDSWCGFRCKIIELTDCRPDRETTEELNRAISSLVEILQCNGFSEDVLQGWQERTTQPDRVRRVGSSIQVMKEEEKIRSLYSRLRRLVTESPRRVVRSHVRGN